MEFEGEHDTPLRFYKWETIFIKFEIINIPILINRNYHIINKNNVLKRK